ncbi:MAG: 4-alpha-glucanotransferase [Planctomycetes bacterium]|nr:4-alpha-glucanotransferase [Planctomycetota bacterium]
MSESLNVQSQAGCREIATAKQQLKIERLVLQIHNASFPADPEEDLGRGSPYTRGAERFFQFAARLGFDSIQLGPRGMTDRGNPSPYDATIFSRNPLDLPLKRYVEQGRLSTATWNSIRGALPPSRQGVVLYSAVFDACQRGLQEIVATASASDRVAARGFLDHNRTWLVPDALYGELCREHGGVGWWDWDRFEQGTIDQQLFDPSEGVRQTAAARLEGLLDQYASEIEDYAFIQWLLDQEASQLRKRLSDLGLSLFGDLQVGLSQRDIWAWRRVFLRDYQMGAPPSRTNPPGQPWGYAVLDPDQLGTAEYPGPALTFVRERIRRLLSECDGVRVDHPHGWIDPWIYKTDQTDQFAAVQAGARLRSSPDDPNHPELSRYSIARPDQIDRTQPLYGDGHVTDLDESQVRSYSLVFDEITRLAGSSTSSVACEVLSTLPYPVGCVLKFHGLGRFRVTQKINLASPADVYRIENASAEDWIMLGTHDTPPIWQLAEQWCQMGTSAAWGQYLADFLATPADRSTLAARIAASPGELINACFAAMLASRAQQVVVFFPDLFGMTGRYNEPGVISEANWSLRLPADFENLYANQLQQGQALNVQSCLQTAVGCADSKH